MASLFLAFTLLPLLDLFLMLRIGRVVGTPSALLYVFAMVLLGVALAKSQGRKVLRAWQEALAAGRVPEEGVLSGVLVLVGALLLILPGVLSDTAGLLCFIPVTRRGIAALLSRHLASQVTHAQPSAQGYGFEWPQQPQRASPNAPSHTARSRTARPGVRARSDSRPFPRTGREDIIDTEGEEV